MALLKRGNTWWCYFYIEGKRHQHSTGTNNRRQAEQIEAKLKQEANMQRFQTVQANPKLTFGELADLFTASGSAKKHHLDRLKALLPYFRDLQITRITHETANEYRTYPLLFLLPAAVFIGVFLYFRHARNHPTPAQFFAHENVSFWNAGKLNADKSPGGQ